MTKHNLQAHEVSCLVQAIDERKAAKQLDLLQGSHEKAKPILVEIVREIEAKGKTDDVIQEACKTWAQFSAQKQADFARKQFGEKGVQLLDIFKHDSECAYYLILSALLNSKRKKEDIKLYTYEQIAAHLADQIDLTTATINDNEFAWLEIILILKLLLEQNLTILAIALETGAGETQLRDFQPQKVEVVKNLMQVLRSRVSVKTNLSSVNNLLNPFKHFDEPNKFAELSKAERISNRWLIGGLLTILVGILVVFFKVFSF